jgi:Fe-S-cluster containining protein
MNFSHPRGVRFQCQRCATCCGDTGTRVRHILLLRLEADRISKTRSQPIKEFARRIKDHEPYVYEVRKTSEGKCVFLMGNDCLIYALRPLICRFYPFELKTTENGKHEFSYTEECKGVGKGGARGRAYFENLFQQANNQFVKDSKKARKPA